METLDKVSCKKNVLLPGLFFFCFDTFALFLRRAKKQAKVIHFAQKKEKKEVSTNKNCYLRRRRRESSVGGQTFSFFSFIRFFLLILNGRLQTETVFKFCFVWTLPFFIEKHLEKRTRQRLILCLTIMIQKEEEKTQGKLCKGNGLFVFLCVWKKRCKSRDYLCKQTRK